jgi:hypothetical protein
MKNTTPAPSMTEAKAATARPPTAGPIARAMLNAALFNAIASGNSSRGTISGTIACQVGPFMAAPRLSKKVNSSSDHAPIQPVMVNTLRMMAATSIQPAQKSSSRRRSRMSAVAPAGKPSSSTGKLAAVCIRAMSNGEAVSAVISQVPAVSCIQLPVFETTDASKRSRKSRRRNGDHTDGEPTVELASVMCNHQRKSDANLGWANKLVMVIMGQA